MFNLYILKMCSRRQCSIQYMAQAQERASGPSLHHFTTPNALQRLSHTHFPAKHEHKASISTSNHNQNTNAGLPYTLRPHGFTQITKCRLAMLPAIPPNSLPKPRGKKRPRLPVPAFSDTTTDPRWLSRDKIYSLDPCSMQYMAQAQERASGPSLHHFTTPTHCNASITRIFQPNMNTKQASRYQSPLKTPTQAFLLTPSDHMVSLKSQNTGWRYCLPYHPTHSPAARRKEKAPPPTCASLFRHHDRSTMAQPIQDIFP